jgi:uncharacterized protein (TIGR00730 family)
MRMKSIVVFCGASSGTDDVFVKEAYAFGKLMASKQLKLVYGGASIGVMGAVANGCLQHGGEAIGIIPHFFETKEVAHQGLSQMVVVHSMHERKLAMYKMADAVVVLPGGFGTMDEFFEILTWSQLGMHQKPIALLNVKDYYSPLLTFMQQALTAGFISNADQQLVLHATTGEELIHLLMNYQPKDRKVWASLKDL